MPEPEPGEPSNVSPLIPRSREDLARRHRCLERIAEWSVGIMGRTPDYMNVTFAGFAGRHDEWSADGNEAGAANLVAYQKLLARRDWCLTHTLIHPTVDRAWRRPCGRQRRGHKVGDRAGIVVRGRATSATLAPFADELAVYPAAPLPRGGRLRASFAIQWPPRPQVPVPRQHERACRTDHPLSSRFDERTPS
jgi:aromatic ring hydroxylase